MGLINFYVQNLGSGDIAGSRHTPINLPFPTRTDLNLSRPISSLVRLLKIFNFYTGFPLKDFRNDRIFLKHGLTQSSYLTAPQQEVPLCPLPQPLSNPFTSENLP